MFFLEQFSLAYLLIAILISGSISLYAWNRKEAQGSRAFAVTCFVSMIWMAGDLIGRLNNDLDGQFAGEVVRYLGVALLPVGLLVFVIRYFGKSISSGQIGLLLIIPFISWSVMITDPSHSFFFATKEIGYPSPLKATYGPYFWFVHLPYCYLLVITAFGIVLMEMTRARTNYRKQAVILFLAFLIPFTINVLGTFQLIGQQLSYTALSFPIFFSIVAIAISRFRFLINSPIAYESVFQHIRDGVLIVDHNEIIRDINAAAVRSSGKRASDFVGRHVREAFENWSEAAELYDRDPHKLGELEVELRGRTRFLNIDSINLGEGPENGRIITIEDITDRYNHQQSLEALAFHDPLTRVANRRKFYEEFRVAIEKSEDTDEKISLLYFDLNGFKEVNDRYGHDVGDQFLRYIAARAASVLRKPDILGRLGGDEFGILLHNCDAEGVEVVVERLLEHVTKPFEIEGIALVADLSIGASVYPDDGVDLPRLLRHADRAMYRAKRGGGGFVTASDLTIHDSLIDM